MSARVLCINCRPGGQPFPFGGVTPEPSHDCFIGQTMPGLLGGWTCPCPCPKPNSHSDMQVTRAGLIFEPRVRTPAPDDFMLPGDEDIDHSGFAIPKGATMPTSIDEDSEMMHGLTIFTEAVSVQVREAEVALYIQENAPRCPEDGRPVSLSHTEARRIRDLLNVATARGAL